MNKPLVRLGAALASGLIACAGVVAVGATPAMADGLDHLVISPAEATRMEQANAQLNAAASRNSDPNAKVTDLPVDCGRGGANWCFILAQLKQINYDGFLILEPHDSPLIVANQRAILALRHLMADAGVPWA